MWCDALCTDEWCGVVALWEADAWCVCDLWCTALDVAATADEAVKAASGNTRPSTANNCLREGVTGSAPGVVDVAGTGSQPSRESSLNRLM